MADPPSPSPERAVERPSEPFPPGFRPLLPRQALQRLLRAQRGRLARQGARGPLGPHIATMISPSGEAGSLSLGFPQSVSFPAIPHLRFKKVLRFREN